MATSEIFEWPAEQLAAHTPISLSIVSDLPALFSHFAHAVAGEIAANNAAGHLTRLILPVGPVGQFPLLAEICNRERISWKSVHAFFMDEYCDWQGRSVGMQHPLSFEGFARRTLFGQLAPELGLPDSQLHFPDPLHLDHMSEAIATAGGIDTCYGGIGIHGHIAFNEPPISRWFTLTPAEFAASKTRLVQLAPETVVMNGSRAAGGNFAALPPMAVTIGMGDILASRRIRLYCQGGIWQRAAVRIALFGSPYTSNPSGEDVNYPVTLLRRHPDLQIIADENTVQPSVPAMAA